MRSAQRTILSIIIPALFALSACAGDPWVEKAWTIMVWLDADNDLEPAGMYDLNEMENGLFRARSGDPDVLDNLNVIVQVDRRTVNTYHPDLGWNSTRRYLVAPDSDSGEYGRIKSIPIDDLGEINMGDAENLKDFIGFCKSNFPARHYMLILWNHGGGVRSAPETDRPAGVKDICLDWQNSESYPQTMEHLYTAEITDVLTAAESVDIIGFDACVMGMAEVAYEYRPGAGKFGASYMVASPPNEGGDGWEYDKILERFKGSGVDKEGDPCYRAFETTPVMLSSFIVKEYADAVTGGDTFSLPYDQAFGAYDLAQITNVKDALDALAVTLQYENPDVINYIQMDGGNTRTLEYFAEADDLSWIFVPHFDLYDFAVRINADTAHFPETTRDLAATLMSAVDECVIASWGLEAEYPGFIQGKHGLGFFFPGNDYYLSEHFYHYEWWYTFEDTDAWWGTDPETDRYYGKLDFCEQGTVPGSIENWRELLEYWYDPGTSENTPGAW